jgi:hypothetical protein
MQFAEDFLTNKKRDIQHHPTLNSCLVRIPRTINSKCAQEVKIIQRWDGQRPAINYLLHDFRRWFINEKIMQRLTNGRRARTCTTNSTTIWWTEKLLQIPISDYRKLIVWCSLAPYLINIRKYSDDAYNTIKNWFDVCTSGD